jgi:uncharacterized protein YijF (DUF1287 family)
MVASQPAGGGVHVRRAIVLGLSAALLAATLSGCGPQPSAESGGEVAPSRVETAGAPPVRDRASARAHLLADAAAAQVGRTTIYDPAYVVLAYPGGDVPIERGVCTDVVVRAMRALDVDMQVAVHEDMSRAWSAYPHSWGLKKPDPSIDHRRVPNLRVYFTREGKALPVTANAIDYQPGDIVTWELSPGIGHTGVVSSRRSDDGQRFLIVHNIGSGAKSQDVLFDYRITGHYRWF